MDLSRVFTWEMPARLVAGPGCSNQAGQELRKLGGSKALLVTDRGVQGAGDPRRHPGGALIGWGGIRDLRWSGAEP